MILLVRIRRRLLCFFRRFDIQLNDETIDNSGRHQCSPSGKVSPGLKIRELLICTDSALDVDVLWVFAEVTSEPHAQTQELKGIGPTNGLSKSYMTTGIPIPATAFSFCTDLTTSPTGSWTTISWHSWYKATPEAHWYHLPSFDGHQHRLERQYWYFYLEALISGTFLLLGCTATTEEAMNRAKRAALCWSPLTVGQEVSS